VVVTSDHDYYQILSNNVSIWDGMKETEITNKTFEEKYKIEPKQHIDVGALMGDSSDNIFGIPGWGEKTALKEIQEHKSWKGVIEHFENKYKDLREKYPDLHTLEDNEEKTQEDIKKEFEDLKQTKSNPKKENSRLKYPEIYWGMPWSGVLSAFEKGEIKMPKSALMALCFQDRINLAYSLKKMDSDIEGLPEIKNSEFEQKDLIDYLDYYDIESLKNEIEILK
jgi:5'-3' exonuclease